MAFRHHSNGIVPPPFLFFPRLIAFTEVENIDSSSVSFALPAADVLMHRSTVFHPKGGLRLSGGNTIASDLETKESRWLPGCLKVILSHLNKSKTYIYIKALISSYFYSLDYFLSPTSFNALSGVELRSAKWPSYVLMIDRFSINQPEGLVYAF